ncbi:hypothetical protein BX616_007269, partial [Lobosporangium transversale]
KVTAEDEEMRKHMQLIGKVSEFSYRSLPPVPPVPAAHASSSSTSRPVSTYSNTSDKERNSHRHGGASFSHGSIPEHGTPAARAPAPVAPEVHAMIDATHKTMATLLNKLEVYRLALEVTENPKEAQLLTNQIKNLMECLKACREVL